MLPFGQLKNNLKRLEDCSKSMGIIAKIGWSKSALDQKQVKNQPVQFYLRIIHYALIEYSTELYKTILDMIPNIKALSDQKFVESSFSICRKMLNVNPKLTVDQFLQQLKWVEKKVEFVAELCESVNKWDQASRKKGAKDKGSNQFKNYLPDLVNKGYQQCEDEEDDDEQLMEREITVKPTQFFESLNHSFGNKPEPISLSKQPAYTYTKPNVFPKNMKNQYLDQEQQDYQLTQTTKLPQRKLQQQPIKTIKQQQPKNLPVPVSPDHSESIEYITKEQFNIALEMIASTNKTINQLAAKFSNFQMNVTSWFNNTNARLVLLQQNVKMIKSNL